VLLRDMVLQQPFAWVQGACHDPGRQRAGDLRRQGSIVVQNVLRVAVDGIIDNR